jgi:hypothetical protein
MIQFIATLLSAGETAGFLYRTTAESEPTAGLRAGLLDLRHRRRQCAPGSRGLPPWVATGRRGAATLAG